MSTEFLGWTSHPNRTREIPKDTELLRWILMGSW